MTITVSGKAMSLSSILGAFGVLWICGCSPGLHCQGEEVPSKSRSLSEYASNWATQDSAIASAEIEFLYFRRRPVGGITEQQFRAYLDDFDISNPPELDKLAKVLDPTLPQAEPGYSVHRLIVSGSSVFHEHVHLDTNLLSVQHGDAEVRKDGPNRQVDIHYRGHSRLLQLSLDDLRYLPRADRIDGFVESEDSPASGESTRYTRTDEYPDSTCESLLLVRNDSGLVLEARDMCRFTSGAGFSMTKLTLQKEALETDGEIAFPRARVSCEFKDDTLRRITICVVDTALFNTEIEEATFTLPGNKGEVVVDYRTNAETPTVFSVDSTESDVVAIADRRSGLGSIDKTAVQKSSVRGLILVIANVTLLGILFVIFLWSRSKKSRQ